MKLLLTSAGVTTQAIADKLAHLVGQGNKKIGFITTAANAEPGNKDWYINQILNLQKYGFDWIDFIDPSASGVDWQARLDEVGIVFVSGGNTFHLLDQTRKTGFDTWLKQNIENIVYVGASAGSILVTPNIGISSVDDGDENVPGITDLAGLSLVDFEVSPHTPEMVSVDANVSYTKTTQNMLYAYNDVSALCVVDDKLEIINEGPYWVLN